MLFFFFFQAEDGIRDLTVTGVQTCALPILAGPSTRPRSRPPRCARSGGSPRAPLPRSKPPAGKRSGRARPGAGRLEALMATIGPPLSTTAWAAEYTAQTLEILPVFMRDGAIFWLKPVHADSEEHTSELQSQSNLVFCLLLY